MGATGIVNALDARTGARLWTRNAERDTGARRPDWAFAASPVVVGDVLVTRLRDVLPRTISPAARLAGRRRQAAAAIALHTFATLAGVPQILLMNGGGITSVGLDGSILWANHSEAGVAFVQPQVLEDGSVLAASGEVLRGLGVRAARGLARRRRHVEGRGALDVAWAEAVLQ